MLVETNAGLFCPAGNFHVDPWDPVERALLTHAHGDHARAGSAAYLCTPETAALLRRRFGPDAPLESMACGETRTIGDARVSFHPAGHVLGSAQIRIQGTDGVWVIGGDYKRAADPTCAPFEPVPCDTFITESTFGLPIYRWDHTDAIIADVLAWWEGNR
ncbi:MAG: ligase-associated DNA damage response exonuclease, partial [Gemmatimonadaceae bacterium]